MSQRRTATIVSFENYGKKSTPIAPRSDWSRVPRKHSPPAQTILPLLSPLLMKCERLEKRNQRLAAVIEKLVDDMLDELEGRRP